LARLVINFTELSDSYNDGTYVKKTPKSLKKGKKKNQTCGLDQKIFNACTIKGI